jgi:hypothetical protein
LCRGAAAINVALGVTSYAVYLPAMRRPFLAALCATAVACSTRPAAPPRQSPPRAEFLVSSPDSTFWVTSDTAIRVRGVPITLARYGGHFYELYTADDDHSYDQALLVGERLYRRDLASGDSAIVFADTTVDRIAQAYARAHPDERPLGPDEEGDSDPPTSATSQIDVLEVVGPYVSFEYHIDVDIEGTPAWQATRRGVVDLRTRMPATVADLFGTAAGRAIADSGRRRYETVRDSILADRGSIEERGAEALRRFHFDDRSFVLSSIDGKPAVTFDVPGRGEGPAGNAIELDPITVDATPWWRDVAPPAPFQTPDGDDRWDHRRYSILARYDSLGDGAQIFLLDSARHAWPVTTILGPIRDVSWLDDPPITVVDRANLARAFNVAATYDQTSRVVMTAMPHATRPVAHATTQIRPRKPARNVRAHDARAREQHGSRVRRRHSVDDGQVGGDRGVSSQSRERRHGVDRSRGLSRADSPGRSRAHEGQRELRRPHVDGSGRTR